MRVADNFRRYTGFLYAVLRKLADRGFQVKFFSFFCCVERNGKITDLILVNFLTAYARTGTSLGLQWVLR